MANQCVRTYTATRLRYPSLYCSSTVRRCLPHLHLSHSKKGENERDPKRPLKIHPNLVSDRRSTTKSLQSIQITAAPYSVLRMCQ
ncbi:hypothetical protein CPAR01_05929 [Colletotrichum paranaense]|uniref:Uncharacterized protein n=1 Tax=Colletotrichum paranaense TaxID=1914294 RepID=A0ABQ9STX6_9PEZI|nr:uncharacterized protein CPAR01_05929 [Colletotrichum paranaense]KAK1542542.1 hypothetical protein CPAR01_05929 [Colletotrichum paranaense]